MKNILMIVSICFVFISCSKEEDSYCECTSYNPSWVSGQSQTSIRPVDDPKDCVAKNDPNTGTTTTCTLK